MIKHRAIREGINNSAISRKLNKSLNTIQKLFDSNHFKNYSCDISDDGTRITIGTINGSNKLFSMGIIPQRTLTYVVTDPFNEKIGETTNIDDVPNIILDYFTSNIYTEDTIDESLKEDTTDKWAVIDDASGDIIDVFSSKDEAKEAAAENQNLRDDGMFIRYKGPFVVEPYYESLIDEAFIDGDDIEASSNLKPGDEVKFSTNGTNLPPKVGEFFRVGPYTGTCIESNDDYVVMKVEASSFGFEEAYTKPLTAKDKSDIKNKLNTTNDSELITAYVASKGAKKKDTNQTSVTESADVKANDATDIVRLIYKTFPELEFVDEKDLDNNQVGLIFNGASNVDQVDLGTYLDGLYVWYKIKGDKLLIKADEDANYLEEDVKGGWEDPEWRKYYGVDDDSFYDPYELEDNIDIEYDEEEDF